MYIRQTNVDDLDRIMEIYAHARAFMAAHGNPRQWGPNCWPPQKLILQDIREGHSYVCVHESGRVAGTFFISAAKMSNPLTAGSTARGATPPPTASFTASRPITRRRALAAFA